MDDFSSIPIRAISWSITLPSAEGRKSLMVDLELALWDAPESLDQLQRFKLSDVNEEDNMDDEDSSQGEEGKNWRSDLTQDSIDEEETNTKSK